MAGQEDELEEWKRIGLPGLILAGASTSATSQPPPQTGRRVVGCYAAGLDSCGGKLNREHYSTRAILEQMPEILLSGAHWLATDEQRGHSAGSLTARVLCEAHNRALSPLDDEAARFYESVCAVSDPRPGMTLPAVRHFNGLLVERWALKFMLGTIAGRIVRSKQPIRDGWEPPVAWLRMLYGIDPFPDDCGLFVLRNDQREHLDSARMQAMEPLINADTGEPIGADVTLGVIRFRLAMVPVSIWDPLSRGRPLRHPSAISLVHPRGEATISLDWPDSESAEGITIRVTPDPPRI